jgi:glycerol-3-phosphate acyltransferase PlsY
MLKLLLPLLGYLVGSVSSAIIVCKLMGLADPRTSGSNNPGASNVLRIGGKKAAAVTLAGDVLKGLLPVMVARFLTSDPIVISATAGAAFIGHLHPVFFGFKGGKGVATALGVYIGLSWILTLALLGIWLLMALLFRYSSLAALTAAALAPVLVTGLLPGIPYLLLTLIVAILLFWRHRENISRLLNGSESRIELGKKSG